MMCETWDRVELHQTSLETVYFMMMIGILILKLSLLLFYITFRVFLLSVVIFIFGDVTKTIKTILLYNSSFSQHKISGFYRFQITKTILVKSY